MGYVPWWSLFSVQRAQVAVARAEVSPIEVYQVLSEASSVLTSMELLKSRVWFGNTAGVSWI